jgi:quercetin dioxygenase-like cupin family protein
MKHDMAVSPPHALTLAKPEDAKFKPVPGAAPCNTMMSLRGDLAKEAATFITKMTAGCIAPWHWHTPTEEIILLKGETVSQMKGEGPITLRAGSYSQLKGKHPHRFRCTAASECITIVVADGPFDIHWVDTAGKEIPFAEASKRAEAEGTAGW